MDGNKEVLAKLGLTNIEGYLYTKSLGGGSALSSLYSNGEKRVVFKFLIAPRNTVEVERFKLECSVLEKNRANWFYGEEGDQSHFVFYGPKESYPLPRLAFPLNEKLNGRIYFFGYDYEEGTLLSDLDYESYDFQEKVELLYRIASGLSYFNQTGYSHRDLHPENILLLDNPSMSRSERDAHKNNPKVRFLDMGNCQKTERECRELAVISRDLDEDCVFEDNNKRVLSSFVSMPPDFLEKGELTKNYDSWAFGIFMYRLFFGDLPFDITDISGITSLRAKGTASDVEYKKNLQTLDLGPRMILNHLLSPDGDKRPSTDSIVRLLSWIVHRNHEFKDRGFISKVIHSDGFDPYYDPVDDYY